MLPLQLQLMCLALINSISLVIDLMPSVLFEPLIYRTCFLVDQCLQFWSRQCTTQFDLEYLLHCVELIRALHNITEVVLDIVTSVLLSRPQYIVHFYEKLWIVALFLNVMEFSGIGLSEEPHHVSEKLCYLGLLSGNKHTRAKNVRTHLAWVAEGPLGVSPTIVAE